jgi:ABC-type multidrug transport system fused ATPase/permease subunit
MEEFFDILKTQNSLPSGSTSLPDIPPSLAASLAAAAAAPAAANGSSTHHDAAALKDRLLSHSQASSSSNGNGSSASANGSAHISGSNGSNGSMHLDQQDLVEAALLLEEQQHPQHVQQTQQTHNLGSASYDVGMPDRSVAISGLGLEVELEDVRFGYQPERQVRLCCFCSGNLISLSAGVWCRTLRDLQTGNSRMPVVCGNQCSGCISATECTPCYLLCYFVLQVLRGVSIHIKPGESVAVVGASGSGKSTILKLATRLYDAASGSVKVNGVDVRDLATDQLRAAVAVVPQDTVLFNDTILQNIRCDFAWVGRRAPGLQYTWAQLVHVAEMISTSQPDNHVVVLS